MSQFLPSGGQSKGASPSASVLPMNIWGWFPLEYLITSTFLRIEQIHRLNTYFARSPTTINEWRQDLGPYISEFKNHNCNLYFILYFLIYPYLLSEICNLVFAI